MSRPYRCPVCYGTGTITVVDDLGSGTLQIEKTCPVCNGECIVWGPHEREPFATWRRPLDWDESYTTITYLEVTV